MPILRLAELRSPEVRALLDAGRPVVVLLPVGSVEPHGPHLPLATDTLISEGACERAAALLEARGLAAVIAPAIPYGVTDFAEGFAGAVSIAPAALTAFVRATIEALLRAGFVHVCIVNNHLEPAHDAAVRASIVGFEPGSATVACPLTRRWARTLSDEFKSGACHAGRYETSLVLATRPELVLAEAMVGLDEVPVSLSTGIREGKHTFAAMGMHAAYAGAPKNATAEEGDTQLALLAAMIDGEVAEALGR